MRCLLLKTEMPTTVALWWGWLNRVHRFIFLVGMCAYVKVSLTPLFLLPTMKDYLALLCRRAYAPSWFTCLNCLYMANSKAVESHRVTLWSHYTAILPSAPADYMSEVVRACTYMYLYAPLGELSHCCWIWMQWGNQALLLVSDTCPFKCWHHQAARPVMEKNWSLQLCSCCMKAFFIHQFM